MFVDPNELAGRPEDIERIEKASMRMVSHALASFAVDAARFFETEADLAGDIGEDITREALDELGVSRAPKRLLGKMDYKRARYVFFPEMATRQALFIDSKAEKDSRTATIQTSQTSMEIRQVRSGREVNKPGGLPVVMEDPAGRFLVTTVFVKFAYAEEDGRKHLEHIIPACIPNGMLQDKYNPSHKDTIWLAGRNAPTLGEEFRVRLSFKALRRKAPWRVQAIRPNGAITWVD